MHHSSQSTTKAVTADMREAEATNQDAERKNEQLQAQLVRQKEKADKAEAQVAELKTENRTWLEMFGSYELKSFELKPVLRCFCVL